MSPPNNACPLDPDQLHPITLLDLEFRPLINPHHRHVPHKPIPGRLHKFAGVVSGVNDVLPGLGSVDFMGVDVADQ
jgi:hypothetical protein